MDAWNTLVGQYSQSENSRFTKRLPEKIKCRITEEDIKVALWPSI